jgi:hypothetical protein
MTANILAPKSRLAQLTDARRAYVIRSMHHNPCGASLGEWLNWHEWRHEWLAVIDDLIQTEKIAHRQLRRKPNDRRDK